MRIVIAAVSSNTSMSGVSRHAANIVRCLLTRSDVSAVYMVVAPWEHKYVCEAVSRTDTRLRIHAVPIDSGTISRNLWYYSDLPAVASQLDADVVHIAYPSPLQRSAFHCPTVVSLHDLYPYDIPANFGFPKVFFNRIVLKQCLRAVDAIACVSDSTRHQLAGRVSQAVLEKAVTVYNCVEAAATVAKHSFLESLNGASFILCIAQHRRNKNILLALKVFKLLLSQGQIDSSERLLIVGMPGPETNRIHRFIQAAGLTERVVLVSGISDAEMQWCYRNCDLLLAPSIVEGFGLPIAEALVAGCPVVCSNIASFREVGGDHCRYVPLGPAAEIAFAGAICDSLRERSRIHVLLPQLSAPVIAEQYLRLYRKLIESAKVSRPTHDTGPAISEIRRVFSVADRTDDSNKQRAARPW